MPLRLEATAPHLWYLPTEQPPFDALLRQAKQLILPEEFARSRRFLNDRARDSYLATRAFVRLVLSQYVDVPPASWKFCANPYGKPEIASPEAARSMRFNLTNTDGLLACVVAHDREVGVDVEALDTRADVEKIADRFFSVSEATVLHGLPLAERRRRFFETWTLKESYVKARGLGLSIPLEKFAFLDGPNADIEIKFDPSLGDDPGNWHFSLPRLFDRHVIAVALARRPDEKPAQWRAAVELVIKPFTERVYESAMGTERVAHNFKAADPSEDRTEFATCTGRGK